MRLVLGVNLISCIVAVGFTAFTSQSFAWGGRGHDMISKVAVKIYQEKYKDDDDKFFLVLKSKSELLGHLANVPDVYWKSFPQDVTRDLNPAHFVDLEYGALDPKLESYPLTMSDFLQGLRKNCIESGLARRVDCTKATDEDLLRLSGSVQFRVQQLYNLMTQPLKALKELQTQLQKQQKTTKDPSFTKEETDLVNESILYAGILSHFIGDLSQPLHVTVDYDGWDVLQGGLHSYFETDVIDEMSYGWFDGVLMLSLKHDFAKKVEKRIFKRVNRAVSTSELALALAFDSLSEKKRLLDIDLKHAVKEKSVNSGGKRARAVRKDPTKTANRFSNIAKERVAVAADMLAFLWRKAVVEAQRPSFDGYRSFYFPVNPEPLALDYYPKTQSK